MPSGDPPMRRRLVEAFDYGAAPSADAPPAGEPPRPPGPRPDSGGGQGGGRRRRRWLTGGALAIVLVVALVAGAVVMVNNKFDLIERLGVGVDAAETGGPRNYLVIGSDSRDGIGEDTEGADVFVGDRSYTPAGQRADAIMIMRVDPGAGRIDVVSVPRDLWVPIAGTGEDERINTAYAGGPQQIIDTIRTDFGIPINHYIEVDFVGFQALVESIGGVPMWFDAPMRDLNSGLTADQGCVTLDGYQALAFVRSRYLEVRGDAGWESDPTGDGGRVSRQQVFLSRVMGSLASNVSLTDLGSLNGLADVAVKHVSIDKNLDVRRAISLGRQFMRVPDGAIQFHSLPTLRWFTQGGADVQLLDPVAAAPLLDLLRGQPLDDVPNQMVQVSVLNGTGVENEAVRTGEALKGLGFQVLETSRAGANYEVTTIRYGAGADRGAAKVAAHLGGAVEFEPDDDLLAGQVVVITGSTFTSVLASPKTGAPLMPPTSAPPTTVSTSVVAPGTAGVSIPPSGPGLDDPAVTAGDEVVGRVPGEPPEGVTCT
jgi:polyisoprenyl-teichoic acid--peptidoglycan teichoic acid transferase